MYRIFIVLLFSFSEFIYCRDTASDCVTYTKEQIAYKDGRIKALYFLPNQVINVKKILLGLIHNEQKSIHFAQFIVNDKDIADALCEAHKRGVLVKGIIDSGNFVHHNQKVTLLQENGIALAIYRKPYSIMHLKCFLFGKNFLDKEILWLGSANTTFSGYKKNQEYVNISENKTFIQQFKEKFDLLYREIKEVAESSKDMIQDDSLISNCKKFIHSFKQ